MKDNLQFESYKFYRIKVNMLISESKRNCLRIFFQDVEDNSGKTWTKISDILNEKCNAKNNIYLNENGQIITRQSLVGNKFSGYIVNVSQNLLKGLGETNNQFQDYLKNPNEHSFFLRETTPNAVARVLKNLDTKKASDLYGISPKFVKKFLGN